MTKIWLDECPDFEEDEGITAWIHQFTFEWHSDLLRESFGLKPAKKSTSQQESQYRNTGSDQEVRERWSLHVDRMLRGKRLTGGGKIIDEERR